MSAKAHLTLVPSLVPSGSTRELQRSGRALTFTLSPSDNSLAAFVTNAAANLTKHHVTTRQPICFVGMDTPPKAERRMFLTDTSVVFTAFQDLLKNKDVGDPEWATSEEVMTVMRKFALDYVTHAKECWVHVAQPGPHPEGPSQFPSDHYRCLYTALSLFTVLYLPQPGYEDGPVGDDLLEWLNVHYIEPSTEEGDHLSGLDRPWEDESFWPYLTRVTIRGLTKASVFFLTVLSRHPSTFLRPFAERLVPVMDSQPRMLNSKTQKDFTIAIRRWKERVKAIRIDMENVPESDRADDFHNWWDKLSDIVGILEGRGEVIARVCNDLGLDWKEVVAAWSIFVDPRMRRDELPDVVEPILDDMPPDPTDPEDMLHAALLNGELEQALVYAEKIDLWLAAHLADLMAPLGFLKTNPNEDSDFSLRDQYIFTYANFLHSDPGLWRITVAYLYSCGNIGRKTGDEILMRVPLRLHKKEKELEEKFRAGEVVGVLKAINESCLEHRRETVRRAVCRIAARTFTDEKAYDLAMEFCNTAEDWVGLRRVVDRVLNEYVANGPESFLRHAAQIAPSFEDLRSRPGLPAISLYRLAFAVRYAEFHQHRLGKRLQDAAWELVEMFQEDVVPKSWWAVLLCDAIELLQYGSALLFTTAGACELFKRLEEVSTRAAQGGGADYLTVLSQSIHLATASIPERHREIDCTREREREAECLRRLTTLRFALARYFARCTMIDVGGKHTISFRAT